MRAAARCLALICAAVLASCSTVSSGSPTVTTGSHAADPARDRLALILARGTIVMTVDPAYPPASFAVEGATRPADTRCQADELTGVEVDGYDVATSKLVAEGLGVEPCFTTPPWLEIVGGRWNDRFDLAFASIGITAPRMADVFFTRPYYATPERFFVATASDHEALGDLDGKRIGVCAACFAELYLQKELTVPGTTIDYAVDDAIIVVYQTEQGGLQDVADGKLDSFLCQETAGNQAIAEGLALRALDPAPYAAFIGGVMDRSSGLTQRPLFDRVNSVLAARMSDGTLGRLATRFFGADYAATTSGLDYGAIVQDVR